jgi:hypothetical protein
LSFGYSLWKGLDFEGSIKFPTNNYGNNIYNLIVNDVLNEIEKRLSAISVKISKDEVYKNYDSIYDAYEYRINKVLNNIKTLLYIKNKVVEDSDEVIKVVENEYLKTFFGLEDDAYSEGTDFENLQEYYNSDEYNQQWYENHIYESTLNNEEYANKYSIYWFRYEKDYKPLNEVINYGLGWKRIEELDNKGIPKGYSANGYLIQKPSNHENRK